MTQRLSLAEYLSKIQNVHPISMDLSLERVKEVAEKLFKAKALPCIVTVGGTNGKGSCVATLEKIYLTAGYKVGAFTSPILFRHTEYARINQTEVTEMDFCESFEKIDAVRGEITLTPFEFTALAVFDLFFKARLDIWILEVGLGGRFDAVNIFNADVAVITSIGIDHVEWLGDTREKIAYEKAGIFRENHPAVCGDCDPPETLINQALKLKVPLFCQGKDFGFIADKNHWTWWNQQKQSEKLPIPSLALQNTSSALMVVDLLKERFPVTEDQLKAALENVKLLCRIECFPGKVTRIFDVSHNPHAVNLLIEKLKSSFSPARTYAVFSMLQDKDILSTLKIMKDYVREWHVAHLNTPRGASLKQLNDCFQQANIVNIKMYESIITAYQSALGSAKKGDCVVIFGSFHTVAETYQLN